MRLLYLLTTSFIFFIVISNVNSQCNRIDFINSSMEYASEKAEQENKKLFVFLHDPNDTKSEFVERALFYKSEVCRIFNEKFVNLKVKSNSTLGQQFRTHPGIRNLPAFFILNAQQNVVVHSDGINTAAELIQFANRN